MNTLKILEILIYDVVFQIYPRAPLTNFPDNDLVRVETCRRYISDNDYL